MIIYELTHFNESIDPFVDYENKSEVPRETAGNSLIDLLITICLALIGSALSWSQPPFPLFLEMHVTEQSKTKAETKSPTVQKYELVITNNARSGMLVQGK